PKYLNQSASDRRSLIRQHGCLDPYSGARRPCRRIDYGRIVKRTAVIRATARLCASLKRDPHAPTDAGRYSRHVRTNSSSPKY
ncbi:MAG: hypothetical protein J7M30_10380, partial [Deltaproteobacteria bacterium]|nr:hypothetical protein [Deltaproteobacteria bacterium]